MTKRFFQRLIWILAAFFFLLGLARSTSVPIVLSFFLLCFYIIFNVTGLEEQIFGTAEDASASRGAKKSDVLHTHEHSPFPCAIVDTEGFVFFGNPLFAALFNESIKKANIYTLLNSSPEAISKNNFVVINKIYYTVVKSSVRFGGRNYTTLYFVKTSGDRPTKDADSISKIAVGIVTIDNYQEARETMREDQWPVITALIDRKIHFYFQQGGGIVSKYEKDRFLVFLTTSALETMKENKFAILDQIREIKMGNAFPVTLSIGFGQSYESLAECHEFARNAMDLALGRGGDQALVKDKQTYHFFGGKSSSVESSSHVRARIKAYALIELIKESTNVFVMGHQRADLDALGAAMGVCVMASHYGKKANIVLDNVNTGICRLCDRIRETQGYQDLFIPGQKAERIFSKNSLLVVVDAHRPSITECPELLNTAEKIVVIDHHRRSEDFIEGAVLLYHEPYASSTSELVTDMLQYVGDNLSMKPIDADALLAGIAMDTKNFSTKTGAKTFDAAGFLRRHRADTIRVRKLLQNDMASYLARADIVRNAQIIQDHFAISVCPSTVENPSLIAAMAADELLNIIGIQISFVVTEQTDVIYISARSLGDINVQRIMEKLGGGGHQTVAGAQLQKTDDLTVDKVIQMIKDATADYIKNEA